MRGEHDTPERPGDSTLVLFPGGTDLLPGFDRWPSEPSWDPAGTVIYFTADDNGRRPVFAVDVASGDVSRLTADDAHYTNIQVAPDGTALYALRDTIGEPPAPVRIDRASGEVIRLQAPADAPRLPGRVTEVTAAADDGHPLRGWLVLPDGASAERPAPLLLWVHGGPMSSWNGWQWRWNPWLAAARGYAVLLPDPALSTGYGLDFIARGYQGWGPRPYADIMAITDAVEARDDIDADRTAMMGGSYGGYMANWIAGHTGRFRAIVSHAGLWALDQMFGTTDAPQFWQREFGAPLADNRKYADNTPHLHIEKITTPDAGDPRRPRLPGAGGRGAAAVVGPETARQGGQVPLLPGREPLDPQAGQRPGLVPDGLRVPRPARARRTLVAPRPAIPVGRQPAPDTPGPRPPGAPDGKSGHRTRAGLLVAYDHDAR